MTTYPYELQKGDLACDAPLFERGATLVRWV